MELMEQSGKKNTGIFVTKVAGAMATMLAVTPLAASANMEGSYSIGDRHFLEGEDGVKIDISELKPSGFGCLGTTLYYYLYDDTQGGVDLTQFGTTVEEATYLWISSQYAGHSLRVKATDQNQTVSNTVYSDPFKISQAKKPHKIGNIPNMVTNPWDHYVDIPLDNVFADEDSDYGVDFSYSSYSAESLPGFIIGQTIINSQGHKVARIFTNYLKCEFDESHSMDNSGTRTVTLTPKDEDYHQVEQEAVSFDLTMKPDNNPYVVDEHVQIPPISISQLGNYGSYNYTTEIDFSPYFSDADLPFGDQLTYLVKKAEVNDSSAIGAVNYDNDTRTLMLNVNDFGKVTFEVNAWDGAGQISPTKAFTVSLIKPQLIMRSFDYDLQSTNVIDKSRSVEFMVDMYKDPNSTVTGNVYVGLGMASVKVDDHQPVHVSGVDLEPATYYGPNRFHGYIDTEALPEGEYRLFTLDGSGNVNVVSEPFLITESIDEIISRVLGLREEPQETPITVGDIIRFGLTGDADITRDGVYDRNDLRYLIKLVGLYPGILGTPPL